MVRLVKITPKEFRYAIFEGTKCIAEFVVENKELLSPEMVEDLRTRNYVVA